MVGKQKVSAAELERALESTFGSADSAMPSGTWEEGTTYRLTSAQALKLIEDVSTYAIDHESSGVRYVLLRKGVQTVLLATAGRHAQGVAVDNDAANALHETYLTFVKGQK